MLSFVLRAPPALLPCWARLTHNVLYAPRLRLRRPGAAQFSPLLLFCELTLFPRTTLRGDLFPAGSVVN